MDRDVVKTWFANGGVLAVVTMAEAEAALKVVLLALTIAFTVRRWWVKEQDRKAGKPFETQIQEKDEL
jgi:hypothetical protein